MGARNLIIFYAWVFMLASTIINFITFIIAYYNPTKTVLVNINTYKEANFELFLYFLGIISVIYMVYNKKSQRKHRES